MEKHFKEALKISLYMVGFYLAIFIFAPALFIVMDILLSLADCFTANQIADPFWYRPVICNK